ncbi:MAG: hypothetical protein ABEH43_00050, partial [Flavobacteriales bacterium]
VDFLSTNVDFKQNSNFHSDPIEIIKIIKNISSRDCIRHDYMPFEFTLYLYKNEEKKKNIQCPKCGSSKTELVSQFGSTACKAHYKCKECKEPFDYFKCI